MHEKKTYSVQIAAYIGPSSNASDLKFSGA
jgi:hypothetical protein